MIFPLLAIAIGMLFVLFYFMRKNVTYLDDGKPGSIWVAIVIFIVFACIGWWIDLYIGFSTIPTFMLAVGGGMAIWALIGIVGFIVLMLGMLIAQMKCGRMVA